MITTAAWSSTKTVGRLLALFLLLSVTLSGVAVAAEPEAPDRELTVLTYNIHHGAGADGRLDLARIAEVIQLSGAEVVGLQEVDRHWSARSDFVDQATWLARELNMHVVYAANLDRDPFEPGQPRRQYGTAILSRYPILESSNTLLPRPAGGEQRGLLEALINVNGVPVRVYNTHLQHNSAVERTAQVEAILEQIGAVDEPTVLLGDLNARPDWPEIQPLYEVLEDAWLLAGEGAGYTYPASAPDRRIDYIFVSPDVTVDDASLIVTELTTLASDHLPLVAQLALPGSAVGIGN